MKIPSYPSAQRISECRAQAQSLPDSDKAVEHDLFAERNYKDLMLGFFDTVLAHAGNPEMEKRLDAADLSGTPAEVWRRINAGGHPVRDLLILIGAGLA